MGSLDAAISRLIAGPASLQALVLVAVVLALAAPGFATLPPVDRDETSFAQASRQMYETGDLVDIRLHDAPRHKKPVGIYWLQAAAVAATDGAGAGHIATYRAVSLAAVVAAVLLTWRIGALLAGGPAGLVAGVMLATALVLGAEARLAKTDAMLLATVLAAQLVVARAWLARHGQGPAAPGRGGRLAFWAALGVGILVKGPIGPMVVGLTAAALSLVERRLDWLRALWSPAGAALFLALVLPWYVAITLRTEGAFWSASLGGDLLGKVGEGQEGHGAPPGSHAVAFWLAFWPASIVVALTLPAMWALRRRPVAVFCLAWAVPTWLVFEAVSTKLLHYTLPVYPALAVLAAAAWADAPPAATRWRRAAALALLALPFVLLALLAAQIWRFGAVPPAPFALGGAICLAGALATWRGLWREGAHPPVAGLVLLAFGLSSALYPGLARVAAIWPSVAVADLRAAWSGCDDPVVISAGYAEPSVVFLTSRDILLLDGTGAAAAMADAPCALAFVAEAERAAFDDAARARGLAPEPVGRVEGVNIGSGRRIALEALARRP